MRETLVMLGWFGLLMWSAVMLLIYLVVDIGGDFLKAIASLLPPIPLIADLGIGIAWLIEGVGTTIVVFIWLIGCVIILAGKVMLRRVVPPAPGDDDGSPPSQPSDIINTQAKRLDE